MSSASDHHAKAEELLEKARTARGEAGRSLILAEAQVHATLALADAARVGTARIRMGHENPPLVGFDPDPRPDPER